MRSVLASAMIFLAALSCGGIAVFALAWGWSSSSLAFSECGGNYSLFADSFRCKQPVLATSLFWGFSVLAVAFLVWFAVRAAGPESSGEV
jgi:hypothetical protein